MGVDGGVVGADCSSVAGGVVRFVDCGAGGAARDAMEARNELVDLRLVPSDGAIFVKTCA